MVIRRSRRLHIGVTKYEWVECAAEIEFDPDVDVPRDEDPVDWADKFLSDLLEPEVEEAAEVTERGDSFIAAYRFKEE